MDYAAVAIEVLRILKGRFKQYAAKWPEFVASHAAWYDGNSWLEPPEKSLGFFEPPADAEVQFNVLSVSAARALIAAGQLMPKPGEPPADAFCRFVCDRAGWAEERRYPGRLIGKDDPSVDLVVRRFPKDSFSHADLAIEFAIVSSQSGAVAGLDGQHTDGAAGPWHDAGESPQDGFNWSIVGTKKAIAGCTVTGAAKDKTRQLDEMLSRNDKFWGRRSNERSFELFFSDEKRFAEADRRLKAASAGT
jgi:hypothetical protein